MASRKSKDKHPAPGEGGAASIPASIQDLHCFTETNGVITSTMNDIPGYRVVKVLGAVYGLTIRSRNWAAGLGMVVKSIAGGELTWFTDMVGLFRSRYAASLCMTMVWLTHGISCTTRATMQSAGSSRRRRAGEAMPSSRCGSTPPIWPALPRCARTAPRLLLRRLTPLWRITRSLRSLEVPTWKIWLAFE